MRRSIFSRLTLAVLLALVALAVPLGWWLVARAQEAPELSPLNSAVPTLVDLAVKFDHVGPQPGDRLPDVPLRTLDDTPFSLGELRGWPHVLLVTSSLTCPKSRSRWPDLLQIAERYPGLHVLLVYVIEAHPVGDVCPYKGIEDVTAENRAAGILCRQPTTMKQRLKLANDFHKRMHVDDKKVHVYVDTMDNLAWTALGAAPNLALLTGGNEIVKYRQGWFKAGELMPEIDRALSPEDSMSPTDSGDREDEASDSKIDVALTGDSIDDAYDIVFGDDEAKADKLLSENPALLAYVPPTERMHDPRGDRTMLMQAAERGLLKVAALLLRHGADVDAQPSHIPSPLHLAAKTGNVEMIDLLLKHKADVNLPSPNGSVTPLDEAVMFDKPAAAKALIAAGAKQDFFTHVGLGNVEAVKDALTLDPARALIPDSFGRPPLAYAAASGKIETAKLLLEAKALPTNPYPTDEQPLLWAARNDHPRFAELLLAAGASPDSKDYEEGSALHIAVEGGRAELIRVLLAHKANTELEDWISWTPLHRAADKGDKEIAQLLLAGHANPNSQQQRYETPCGENDYAPATLDTPLHVAAVGFDSAMVGVLIEGGANANAENAAGLTPLGMLAGVGKGEYAEPLQPGDFDRRLKTVRVLLAAGARTSGPAEHGGTVRDFLRELGDAEISKSLGP